MFQHEEVHWFLPLLFFLVPKRLGHKNAISKVCEFCSHNSSSIHQSPCTTFVQTLAHVNFLAVFYYQNMSCRISSSVT